MMLSSNMTGLAVRMATLHMSRPQLMLQMVPMRELRKSLRVNRRAIK